MGGNVGEGGVTFGVTVTLRLEAHPAGRARVREPVGLIYGVLFWDA